MYPDCRFNVVVLPSPSGAYSSAHSKALFRYISQLRSNCNLGQFEAVTITVISGLCLFGLQRESSFPLRPSSTSCSEHLLLHNTKHKHTCHSLFLDRTSSIDQLNTFIIPPHPIVAQRRLSSDLPCYFPLHSGILEARCRVTNLRTLSAFQNKTHTPVCLTGRTFKPPGPPLDNISLPTPPRGSDGLLTCIFHVPRGSSSILDTHAAFCPQYKTLQAKQCSLGQAQLRLQPRRQRKHRAGLPQQLLLHIVQVRQPEKCHEILSAGSP